MANKIINIAETTFSVVVDPMDSNRKFKSLRFGGIDVADSPGKLIEIKEYFLNFVYGKLESGEAYHAGNLSFVFDKDSQIRGMHKHRLLVSVRSYAYHMEFDKPRCNIIVSFLQKILSELRLSDYAVADSRNGGW